MATTTKQTNVWFSSDYSMSCLFFFIFSSGNQQTEISILSQKLTLTQKEDSTLIDNNVG